MCSVIVSMDVIRHIVEMSLFTPISERDFSRAFMFWTMKDDDGYEEEYAPFDESWCGHISYWRTLHITDMSHFLRDQYHFDEPLYWDTSNVTDMSLMFLKCIGYNQPIHFDTRNVVDMNHMFYRCDV